MDTSPVTLEGRTVRLEPLGLHHLDAMCAVGLDPSLWALTTIRIASRDDMRGYLETALAEQAAGSAIPFATVVRATGTVAGSTRLANVVPPLNARSRAAILRIGATEEGTLRRHMVNADGSARDSVYCSIIDDEWPSVRRRLEEMLGR